MEPSDLKSTFISFNLLFTKIFKWRYTISNKSLVQVYLSLFHKNYMLATLINVLFLIFLAEKSLRIYERI